MAHGGPRGGRRTGYHRRPGPQSLALVGRRLGTALLGAAVPALLATVGAAAVVGEAAGDPLGWVDTAVATALLGGQGLPWAFHVALVVALLGVSSLALAFFVEGLFDLE